MLSALVLCWLACWSAAAFAVCGWDKHCARRQRRRVPERTLHRISLLGGACGMFLGMRVFRHKTKHASFVWGVPAAAVLHIALAAWVYLRF